MRPALHGVYRIVLISLMALFLLVPMANGWAETELARVFSAAWQRQPAAAALLERGRAAKAQQAAASALLAAPPSFEIAGRSDRYHQSQGAEQRDIGLVLPLWLPGERGASQALADAEGVSVERRAGALRLQLAALVREAWWAWQAAHNELVLAVERVAAAQRLRDDVALRYRAGDVSKADLNSAIGTLAWAQGQAAESEVALAQAHYRLQSLSGQPAVVSDALIQAEPLPDSAQTPPTAIDQHPQWLEMLAQVARAEAEVELALQQTRANPQLSVSTRREQGASSDPVEQSIALALRIPFGAGPRQDARVAIARADLLERRGEAVRQRERLLLAAEMAQSQVDSARRLLVAAESRAQLARENLGFFEKSFRLGETDLPTRLRIGMESFEAERALGRARIVLALGISQWRQSLGLLPE